jgi:hypothetical protein
MVKKIIEVPEGAAKIIFAPDAEDEHIDELSFMLHHRVFIEDLPDAPEKRVVELPADVINQFETAKEQSLSVFDFLMYEFTVPNDVIVTNNRLANWYLGHIDFVPKEENK